MNEIAWEKPSIDARNIVYHDLEKSENLFISYNEHENERAIVIFDIVESYPLYLILKGDHRDSLVNIYYDNDKLISYYKSHEKSKWDESNKCPNYEEVIRKAR